MFLNRSNHRWLRTITLALTFLHLLTACATTTTTDPIATTSSITLEPYTLQTTPVSNATEGSSLSETPTVPQPTLTPTPIYYTVVEGDTLSSIAFRHQVTLADLLLANPNIDPYFLTIGISVTIPISGSLLEPWGEPTPIPLNLGTPVCYPYNQGGLFCLISVTNEQPFDVESINASLSIESLDSQIKLTHEAKSLLNILKSGNTIALSTYIPGPVPTNFQAAASISSVLPVASNDSRYLPLDLSNLAFEISGAGHDARIYGSVFSPPNNPVINRVWLLAVAFDGDHKPVGIRKWISNSPLKPGNSIPFQFNIYSIGEKIKDIEVTYEATP